VSIEALQNFFELHLQENNVQNMNYLKKLSPNIYVLHL